MLQHLEGLPIETRWQRASHGGSPKSHCLFSADFSLPSHEETACAVPFADVMKQLLQ